MKIQIKFFVLGVIACLLGVGSILGLMLFISSDITMTFHEQMLPSGKSIKVTRCNLVWGVEHADRFPNRDCFALEYIMSLPNSDQQVRDREAMEVFELIRPISEQWGLDKAELYAFPTTKRKGIYYIYTLKRNSDGKWAYEQHPAKVHIND
jgi:hypothetical protein